MPQVQREQDTVFGAADEELALTPAPADFGDSYMHVASASLVFPKGGGVATTEKLDSLVKDELYTIISGITVETLDSAARTFVIRDEADTKDLFSLAIPAAIAGQLYVPRYIQFGRGLPIAEPWGVKNSAAGLVVKVWFRRASELSVP